MKNLITVGVIFWLCFYACKSEIKDIKDSAELNNDSVLPIEQIKKLSPPREKEYNLSKSISADLKPIDSTFFIKHLEGIVLHSSENGKLIFDKYSRYYFFDYVDLKDKFLFSILHDDEIGYGNLYHFTYDKTNSKIISADCIAATGGDGGHSNNDYLQYNKNGDELKITSVSTYDEDFEKGFTRDYDSTVSKFIFKINQTTYLAIDSLSKRDTIWGKN